MEDVSDFIDDFIKKEGKDDPLNLFKDETIVKFWKEMVKKFTREELENDVISFMKMHHLAKRLLYNKKTLNKYDTRQIKEILGII